MLNCKDTIEKLYGYLDRQLSDGEAQEVREHLQNCQHCDDHFRFEENVLTRVHSACHETRTPADLKDRIRKACNEARSNA